MTGDESKHTTPSNGGDSEKLPLGDVVAANSAPGLDSVPYGMLNYRIPEFDYQKFPVAPMSFDNYVKLDNYHIGAFNGYYGLPNDFDAGRRNDHFASLSGNSTVDGDSIAEEDEPLGPDGSIPPPNKRDPIYTAVSGLKWKAKSKKWVVRWDNPHTNRRVYKYFSGARYGFLGAHKRAKYYLEFLNASVGKCEAPSINNPFCRRTEGPPKGKTNKGLLKRLETKRSTIGNGLSFLGGGISNQHSRCGTLPTDPYLHYGYYSSSLQDVNFYNGQCSSNAVVLNGFNNLNNGHGHGHGHSVNGNGNGNGNRNDYTHVNAVANNGPLGASPFNSKKHNANAVNNNGGVCNSKNGQSFLGNSRNNAWVLEHDENIARQQQQQKREEEEQNAEYFGYI